MLRWRSKLFLQTVFDSSGWKFDPIFEERLGKEIAKTELLRVNILIGAMIIAFSAGAANLFLGVKDNAALRIKSELGLIAILFLAFLTYEMLNAFILRRHVRKRQAVSRLLQFFNIFIETSFPTIFTILLFQRIPGIALLFTPALLVYFLFIVLSTLHLNFWMSAFTGVIACAEYYLVSFYILHQLVHEQNSLQLASQVLLVGRSVLLLLCGFAAGFVALEIRRRINATFQVMNERSKIRQVLGQQVSHAVVDRIINEGMLQQHERRMVCVMFLDIRNFTPFASGKAPEEVMDYQNKIFGIAIESVNKYNGIINQFLGDGFMATFGAPISYDNDCRNAVDAAIEILEGIQKACDDKLIPATRLGIGIHYGEAITGNVGTELRRQYSIIGNVVIQASRIEQLNKEFHSQLLISREVLQQANHITGESLGPVMLKGERLPVEIVRIR
ncbi:MAG TPA: adenylate/guanylate cyclase domain-containing protein [Chitinophagales bacterium]|nr:adenylate/guanylate cyclase domain-containing protein [Chitinophagales bacterium]